MNTLKFIDLPEFPLSETEKETTILLLHDHTVDEITDIKYLSYHGVQTQIKRIREKMNAHTFHAAAGRMFALGIITKEELVPGMPSDWTKHRLF